MRLIPPNTRKTKKMRGRIKATPEKVHSRTLTKNLYRSAYSTANKKNIDRTAESDKLDQVITAIFATST